MPRQRDILPLIREWTKTTGSAPMRPEIARRLGLRLANAAKSHLKALAKKGVLELLPSAARGMSMRDAGILDGDLLAVHRRGKAL